MLESRSGQSPQHGRDPDQNAALYAIACLMYMIVGYNLMYPGAWPQQYLAGTRFLSRRG